MKISDTPLFKITPPILPTPPFLWKKSEPPFFRKFQKLKTLFIKGGGGGGSNYVHLTRNSVAKNPVIIWGKCLESYVAYVSYCSLI